MNSFVEFWLTIHRITWFPLHWALGLERPGMADPFLDPATRETFQAHSPVGPKSKTRRASRGGSAVSAS